MIDKESCRESMHIRELWNNILYNFKFKSENPTYFDPDGLVVFVGPQGSGKTMSAVNYVYKLMKKYPKAKLVTNLMLTDYPIVTFDEYVRGYSKVVSQAYFDGKLSSEDVQYLNYSYRLFNKVFPFDNSDDLEKYSNDQEGVIFLIDEVSLYFNSLESKNINPEVMVQIAQQRKQRKHIVTTSQVFGRMAKPLREQFSNVIVCENYFKLLQHNRLVDRDTIDEQSDDAHIKGAVKAHFWWWLSPKYFKKYDTYYTISRTKFISNEKKKVDIYGSNERLIESN